MIRWTDGLYGGLIAGVVSAMFFLLVGMGVIHEPVLGRYFVDFAVAIFGSRIENLPAIFGIFYATLAARFKPAWSAPTSVLCGITYGFFMFFVAEDVMVPLLRVVSYTPAWEGLVGNVVFHGIIVSEYITIAHRRNLAGAA